MSPYNLLLHAVRGTWNDQYSHLDCTTAPHQYTRYRTPSSDEDHKNNQSIKIGSERELPAVPRLFATFDGGPLLEDVCKEIVLLDGLNP